MPSPTLPSEFSGKTVAAVYASDEEDGAPFSPYSGDVTADGKVDRTATHSGGNEHGWTPVFVPNTSTSTISGNKMIFVDEVWTRQ